MEPVKPSEESAPVKPPWTRLRNNFATDAAAAFVMSAGYSTVFYPLHRIKVVLHTQDSHPKVVSGQIARYHFLTSFGRIIRENGVADLWRGNLPYMMRHVPSTTLSFAFKDFFTELLPRYDAHTQLARNTAVNVLVGGLAGGMALAIVYPLDFTTIRMAADLGPAAAAQSMKQTLFAQKQAGGLLSLYRGFGVSVLGISAYKALYFGLYETAKGRLFRPPEGVAGAAPQAAWEQPGLVTKWAVASTVVYVASTVTYPLDVLRKRLVADTASPVQRYRGFWDCVRQTARTEGVRGFYRFYGVDMLLRFGGGVLLVVYDELKGASRKAEGKAASGPGAAAAVPAAAAVV